MTNQQIYEELLEAAKECLSQACKLAFPNGSYEPNEIEWIDRLQVAIIQIEKRGKNAIRSL